MPALDDILSQKLQLLAAKQQKRTLTVCDWAEGVQVLRGGKRLVSFSSNDYLGLSHHPDVIAASIAAAHKYGTGAGASRLVTGNHPLYEQLENALADYKKTEDALVFGSGYLANLGAIPALVGKNDLILADKFIHACMLDAARLSGATLLRFAHNNVEHCKLLLEAHRAEHSQCLILTETVFSMDGDRAPMAALQTLADEHDAWLMSDDAHDLCVYPELSVAESKDRVQIGERSLGCARDKLKMGTLSKALGSYGGYVCGSKVLKEYLVNMSRSLIFSTGLPPSVCAASIAALAIVKASPELCEKPLANAQYFTQLTGLSLAQSAIVPVILGENEKALKASALLEKNGFLVAAIRPPTVPENTARLRFAFSALHTREQIERVASLLLEKGFICAP